MAGRWGCQVLPSEWENSFFTRKYTELVATLRVEKKPDTSTRRLTRETAPGAQT
ncbi:hypothetical protein E2C01_077825 [Portunus trituberculatus]|uniref:Uncharacterized protein n=1 Tax=Portunus trituberculatus TaxID=210409 RepID=A0A5B7IH01_PORTR|nr:hypothetical protein [Portunus trituberculatus]